jgi:hypothetical protein
MATQGSPTPQGTPPAQQNFPQPPATNHVTQPLPQQGVVATQQETGSSTQPIGQYPTPRSSSTQQFFLS